MPPKKLKGVPAAAVFNEEEWELGKRDRNGRPVGAFTYWWPSTGKLSGESFFEKNKETRTRYHTDGTISHQGVLVDDKPMVGTMYLLQRSTKKTTERALQIPAYKAVFRMEQYAIKKGLSKWKNFDRQGRRIDLEGNLLHTVDPKKYAAKNFGKVAVPKVLLKLIAFQNDVGSENFAQGFVLDIDDRGLIKNFCDREGRNFGKAKKFLAAMIPIAAATGTGSWYFLWNNGKKADAMPVVVFGDEGGYHVVAKNLAGLLQIVGTDVEPMVDHDGVSYFKAKDEDPSDEIAAYRTWLKAELGLAPAKPATIVKQATAIDATFQAWIAQF